MKIKTMLPYLILFFIMYIPDIFDFADNLPLLTSILYSVWGLIYFIFLYQLKILYKEKNHSVISILGILLISVINILVVFLPQFNSDIHFFLFYLYVALLNIYNETFAKTGFKAIALNLIFWAIVIGLSFAINTILQILPEDFLEILT
ncbi:hypothetical protein ACFLSQ_03935 [Bacteroidota bacterium]